MTSIALPPLDCAEIRPSLGERLVNGAVVVALHLLLAYGALYLSVKNDLKTDAEMDAVLETLK